MDRFPDIISFVTSKFIILEGRSQSTAFLQKTALLVRTGWGKKLGSRWHGNEGGFENRDDKQAALHDTDYIHYKEEHS